MATAVLHSYDLIDFEEIPHPHLLVQPTPGAPVDTFTHYRHPNVGFFKFNSTALPHMHVMDMRWDIANDVEVLDSTPSDNIHINFQLDGHLYSQFNGLSHDLDMRPKRHNLIYTPDLGHTNLIKGNQLMEMLLISLDKHFFASIIGPNYRWSERVLHDLHHQRPFSGITGTQAITPQMLHLLNDIRTCKARGPMRNLLIQSRVLELIALEIEQFSAPSVANESLRPDETEKIFWLKTYLDTNFLADLTLTQLSRFCVLNEFKVKKGFKQVFGTTVFSYVRQLRMEYAGRLLRDSSMSVDDVADALGYEHAQHFSIAFKKYTGLTPSQYQQGKKPGLKAA
ncbi:AraC family transcriptional regulator [Spirosoma sp. KNUC1025]|uniref:helix-turn-helix transcriptional regulator n=1 Tax=Spirosoma sp. KNUC1025 TaxID=2894082 RepID=UPI00386AF17D|nr:AraC family transcriptional regulator [Spirosoma sp. KNUC1025]